MMNKYLSVILLFALIFISGFPAYAATAICSGSSVICDNGKTPFCSNAGGFPVCQTGLYNGPPCCDYSNSGLPCGRYEPIDTPQCPTTPSSPVIPPTQPSLPTSSCNASLLLVLCNSQGLSPNFTACTCNASTAPTSTSSSANPSVRCATGLTACPNTTTSDFKCCQNGCCPSNPYLCERDCPTAPTPITTFKPELVVNGPEAISLQTNPKIFNITVTGLKFPSTSNCSVSTTNTNLRMRFNPTHFTLRAGKSSEDIRVFIRNLRALRRTDLIKIKVTCDNNTNNVINIDVLL